MRSDIIGTWKCVAHQATVGQTPWHSDPKRYTDYTFYDNGTAKSVRKGMFGRTVTETVDWDYDWNQDAFAILVDGILFATMFVDGNEMGMVTKWGPMKNMAFRYKRA